MAKEIIVKGIMLKKGVIGQGVHCSRSVGNGGEMSMDVQHQGVHSSGSAWASTMSNEEDSPLGSDQQRRSEGIFTR